MKVSIWAVGINLGIVTSIFGLSTTGFGAVLCHQAQTQKHSQARQKEINIFKAKEKSLEHSIIEDFAQVQLALKFLETPKQGWNPLENSLLQSLAKFGPGPELSLSGMPPAHFSPDDSMRRILSNSKHFDFLAGESLTQATSLLLQAIYLKSSDLEMKAVLFNILISHNRISDPQIQTKAIELTHRMDRIKLSTDSKKVIGMLAIIYPNITTLAEYQARLFSLPILIQQKIGVPEESLKKINWLAKAYQNAGIKGVEFQTAGQTQALAEFKQLLKTDPYLNWYPDEIQVKMLLHFPEMTTPESVTLFLTQYLASSDPKLKRLADDYRRLSGVRHQMDDGFLGPSSSPLQ